MLKFGEAPYLECSSKGDRRFSALFARIKKYNNRSIEELYQAKKVFEDGTTNLSWREAKGRKAINMAELEIFYKQLWIDYLSEHPEFIVDICNATGLSDIFGQKGHNCQAKVLWDIRSEILKLNSKKESQMQVEDLIQKAMIFDPVLENTDPSILTHKTVPFDKLKDSDLEDLFQYKYPQNVEWLKTIRMDFIERCHPEVL